MDSEARSGHKVSPPVTVVTHRVGDRSETTALREKVGGRELEDFDVGEMVPCPRYYGTMTWVFEWGEQ